MKNKLFEEKNSQINQAVSYAYHNKFSDFYKQKYRKMPLTEKYEDFLKIPFLTKQEILDVDLKKRIFIPRSEISYYSISSGTENAEKILILPHYEYVRTKRTFEEERLKKLGVEKALALVNPGTHYFQTLLTAPRDFLKVIPGNINKLDVTAILTKSIGIEAVFSTPTAMYFFTTELEKVGYDLSKIKFISLGGEHCTSQKYLYFKEKYPAAHLTIRMGVSEIGGRVGYQCDNLTGKLPLKMHFANHLFVEILDEKGQPAAEGEIVITDLRENKGFPLIRYRTRDIGKIEYRKCQCGAEYTVEMGGRTGSDLLRVHGVILATPAISNSLETVSSYLNPDFEAHVFERNMGGKIKPEIVLRVSFKEKCDPDMIRRITDTVSRSLYVSSDKTLSFFVENKIFLPLRLEEKSTEKGKAKSKNIISHLS